MGSWREEYPACAGRKAPLLLWEEKLSLSGLGGCWEEPAAPTPTSQTRLRRRVSGLSFYYKNHVLQPATIYPLIHPPPAKKVMFNCIKVVGIYFVIVNVLFLWMPKPFVLSNLICVFYFWRNLICGAVRLCATSVKFDLDMEPDSHEYSYGLTFEQDLLR